MSFATLEITGACCAVIIRRNSNYLEFIGDCFLQLDQSAAAGVLRLLCSRAPMRSSTIRYEFSNKDQPLLSRLSIQNAERASLTLFDLPFDSSLQLQLSNCSLSSVNFKSTGIRNLSVQSPSARQCFINFEERGVLLEKLEAQLRGTALNGVTLDGCSWSSLQLEQKSFVQLAVRAGYQEKTLEFRRDQSSSSRIYLPDGVQRSVSHSYERWTVDSSLKVIYLDEPRGGEEEDLDETGEGCVICQSADPDCLLSPCQHRCVCTGCFVKACKQYQQLDCPICRQRVETAQFTVPG